MPLDREFEQRSLHSAAVLVRCYAVEAVEAVKAVEAVDFELGQIFELAKEQNYNIILTSDHGNCEMMKDDEGNILTNHTVGDVYCFVYSPKVKEVKTGSLNNIAPTVLKLMNLEIPKEMDEPLI